MEKIKIFFKQLLCKHEIVFTQSWDYETREGSYANFPINFDITKTCKKCKRIFSKLSDNKPN